jgi:hypothetical protein|tara:strand:+ start:328 stop:924 length:597 start_codon:yes stop_codon:yes gene_type:complete
MPVKIHGKEYTTVVERINDFRNDERFEGWSIETDIISTDIENCIIKAIIKDSTGKIVGTGLAHEVQGSTNINKTSHVENCETSAIGRALANIGKAGTEYASANEVSDAIINQKVEEATEKLRGLVSAVLSSHSSIVAIKEGIALDNLSEAAEEWFTLEDDIKASLWIAPSKGGVFTTREREVIKSSEFRMAHFGGSDE